MASKKETIKLNKKHGGKEFSNYFRFIGQVKPVRKKEDDGDGWYDVPFYQQTTTQTNKQRRVLQFNLETAYRNELKVELAGMEKDKAYAYSSTHKNTISVDWADRNDKSKLPDDTYHVMIQEWDLTEELSEFIVPGMWADVRGSYEFEVMTNDEGKEFKLVKRIIKNVYPLKNGEIHIKGMKENDEFRVYPTEKSTQQIGYGKADKSGVVKIKTGWLSEKGSLFVCKVENNEEGKRAEVKYEGDLTETERFTVVNNLPIEVNLTNSEGKKDKIFYVTDFNSENFKEINTYEMQIGIKSTYQNEESKDTKVNAVYLGYGKEKSVPKDVELTVFYKEAEEGKTPLASAFARLNHLDFMKVTGIDNNRAEFAMVAVEDTGDNPFADVEERTTQLERVTTGTKKGLEILSYVAGSYVKELLTEDEITPAIVNETKKADDPFTSDISDDDLPF